MTSSPILTRAGCADGSCHAKSGGQNGFQLSIFSYDPKTDHHALAFAGRGRRTMPDAPPQSLLLRKATEASVMKEANVSSRILNSTKLFTTGLPKEPPTVRKTSPNWNVYQSPQGRHLSERN